MNQAYFYIASFTLASIYLLFGYWSAKGIHDRQDYFLAGRKLGVVTIAFTLIATQIGGGLILGTSEEAYHSGIYALAYSAGMVLAFLILGFGLAAKLRGLNVATTAEIFASHYNSSFLRKVAAIFMVMSLSGILVAQIIAARKFMLAVGISNEILFILFWLFVIAYTMIGGLKAVVYTDILQTLVIFIVFVAVFFYIQSFFPISNISWIPQQVNVQYNSLNWVVLLIMPVLFNTIEQDIAQRFFAARNKRVACMAALIAAVIIIIFALIPVYFGSLAKQLQLVSVDGGAIIITVLQLLTSDFVIFMVALGLLTAIISSADSLLCGISSNISQDFSWHWLGEKHQLLVARMITLICGLTALLLAYQFDNILAVLIYSFALPVSCLSVAIFAALFLSRVYTAAAYASVIAGLLGFFITTPFDQYIPVELVPVSYSLLAYLLTHFTAKIVVK